MSALSSTDNQGQFESFNAKFYPSIDGEISHFNKLMMHAAKISLVKNTKKKQTVVWQYMQTVKETITTHCKENESYNS